MIAERQAFIGAGGGQRQTALFTSAKSTCSRVLSTGRPIRMAASIAVYSYCKNRESQNAKRGGARATARCSSGLVPCVARYQPWKTATGSVGGPRTDQVR